MPPKTTHKSVFGQAPGGKTWVIRIEISHLNGQPFDHALSVKDIKNIWTQALKLDLGLLRRQASFRGPNNTLRINYCLFAPTFLSEVIKTPEIQFERDTIKGIDTSRFGKIVDQPR